MGDPALRPERPQLWICGWAVAFVCVGIEGNASLGPLLCYGDRLSVLGVFMSHFLYFCTSVNRVFVLVLS